MSAEPPSLPEDGFLRPPKVISRTRFNIRIVASAIFLGIGGYIGWQCLRANEDGVHELKIRLENYLEQQADSNN